MSRSWSRSQKKKKKKTFSLTLVLWQKKLNVVKRGMYSKIQRHASSQWSKFVADSRAQRLSLFPPGFQAHFQGGVRGSPGTGLHFHSKAKQLSTREKARLVKQCKDIYYFIKYFERHCLSSSRCYKLWLSETGTLHCNIVT